MPKVSYPQTNFTAGEFSPRVYGRTDLDRYNNGCKILENAHPVFHGGATRRAGTRWAKETKNSAKKTRVIDFIYSKDLAYMLEFGDLYIRVFSPNGVYAGIEVVSPYTEAMLADIDYCQSADAMFIFHPSVPIQRLRRFTDASWNLAAAPFTVQPFDEQGLAPATNVTLSGLSGAITATASGASFLPSDVGRNLISIAGIGLITGYTSTTLVNVNTSVAFIGVALASGSWYLDVSPQTTLTPSVVGPVGAAATLTLAASGWRAGDVGKYVQINGGIVKATAFTSDTILQGTIVSVLSSTTAAPALSWSLEANSWNSTNGYPRTGTLFEQRLWAAGTTKQPQTIWGSKTALYLDFTKGTADSDGCQFTIASDEVNPITYLVANRNILIHTYGGELALASGNEKPITPTNVQIKPQTAYGSKTVRPIQVGSECVFVQRNGRKVRTIYWAGYQFDRYKADDLTLLAEHVTAGIVVSMAFQQDPDQLIWLVLADGTLISCTIDRDQSVTGWARHITDGAFESVACIPNGTQDQVWVIVRRTIDGSVKRYVEYLDNTFQPIYPVTVDPLAYPPADEVLTYGCTVDCGVVVDNASGQTVFGSLGHLEGKTVDVVADGSPMPTAVVTGGSITLPRASFRTLIGLHFKSTITLLTPEFPTGTGTAQGNSMSTRELTMRFLNTVGAQVLDGEGRAQEVPFRYLGTAALDTPPPVYSGLLRVEMLGWERGRSELSIVQDQPLPLHLLSVVRKITVND